MTLKRCSRQCLAACYSWECTAALNKACVALPQLLPKSRSAVYLRLCDFEPIPILSMARGYKRTGAKVVGTNPAERLLTRYIEYVGAMATTETAVQFTMWKARTCAF